MMAAGHILNTFWLWKDQCEARVVPNTALQQINWLNTPPFPQNIQDTCTPKP